MKHFKYHFSNTFRKRLLEYKIKHLTKCDRKNYQKKRFLDSIFKIIYSMVVLAIIVIDRLIQDEISLSPLLETLIFLLILICAFLVPFLLIYFPYKKIKSRIPKVTLPNTTFRMIRWANHSYWRYYKINNHYMITKCFYCTDERLINRDLILYMYKDKLRIVNDFTRSRKDFGCYELLSNEFKLYYETYKRFNIAVIETDKFKFILGKKAKPFIINNFGINKIKK